jgi:hypothetical protein
MNARQLHTLRQNAKDMGYFATLLIREGGDPDMIAAMAREAFRAALAYYAAVDAITSRALCIVGQ